MTIVSIATPPGIGSVSIVRISGKDALKAADKILFYKFKLVPREVKNCVVDTGEVKDSGLAIYFKGPNSYTGEDVVEIHLHGNYFLVQRVVKRLIELGVRQAEAGEFTKRAFLNGKMDLSQAEAVLDIINAKSESQINLAFNGLEGRVLEEIVRLQNKIVEIAAGLAVVIDYPEENLDESEIFQAHKKIVELVDELEKVEKDYIESKGIREGVRVTILGEPNVGKSSLLNALLGYNRAIVDGEAGTTRDTIEDSYLYNGIQFIVTDTAGIRETLNRVEMEGVKRSEESIKNADIILDFSGLANDKKVIRIINKIDLDKNYIEKEKAAKENEAYISALKNINIDKLKEKIYCKAVGTVSTNSSIINNIRQFNAVNLAKSTLVQAKNQKNIELLLSDILTASRALAAVTGEVVEESIVSEIFSKFCVGK